MQQFRPKATPNMDSACGYYHLDKDPNLYLQIMMKNNKMVLQQLWDDREITFEQKSAFYFYNEQQSFAKQNCS